MPRQREVCLTVLPNETVLLTQDGHEVCAIRHQKVEHLSKLVFRVPENLEIRLFWADGTPDERRALLVT
jgi:hypothetical protein